MYFAYQCAVSRVARKPKHWRVPNCESSRYSKFAIDVTRITKCVLFSRLVVLLRVDVRSFAPEARVAGNGFHAIDCGAAVSECAGRLVKLVEVVVKFRRTVAMLCGFSPKVLLAMRDFGLSLIRVISILIWNRAVYFAYQCAVSRVARKPKHWQSPNCESSRYSKFAIDVTRITKCVLFSRLVPVQ